MGIKKQLYVGKEGREHTYSTLNCGARVHVDKRDKGLGYFSLTINDQIVHAEDLDQMAKLFKALADDLRKENQDA